MREKTDNILKNIFIYVTIVLLSLGTSYAGCYLLKKPTDDLIRNMTVAVIFAFVIVLLLATGAKNGLLFNNYAHLGRFLTNFLFGCIFVAVSYFIPVKLWPILILAVTLSLTSNAVTGMISYLFFVFMACFFQDASVYVFFMCIFVGVCGIGLFQTLDKDYYFGGPLFASLSILFIGETGFLVIFENSQITLDTFVLPMVNVFISLLILLLFLQYYSKFAVHKYRNKFQEITDTEYKLLTDLKETNQEEYYHAMHTAYLCDKLARKIGADHYLAKAGGFYLKIGVLEGDPVFENTLEMIAKNNFPSSLLELIEEYGDKRVIVRKKETAIVILSDAVISSILFLLSKNKDAVIQYDHVVDIVFRQKLTGDTLAACNITLEELTIIKNSLIEEKLYYDFLR